LQRPGSCGIAGACVLELLPAALTAAAVIALVIRERMWLRHCRYLHDQAVKRGQNPDPAQLIQAARGGRLQQAAEQVQRSPASPPKRINSRPQKAENPRTGRGRSVRLAVHLHQSVMFSTAKSKNGVNVAKTEVLDNLPGSLAVGLAPERQHQEKTANPDSPARRCTKRS
jgi:hypothetical protein